MRAAEIVATAIGIDPTLTDMDRRRNIDLIHELLRQLKPLARQAEVTLKRKRLVTEGADPIEIARLGRTNPVAPEELEALSERCLKLATRVANSALPDWNTPQRIKERSARLLPPPWVLEEIVDELRHAVKPSLDLSHPAPDALRLADLAAQISEVAKSLDDKASAA